MAPSRISVSAYSDVDDCGYVRECEVFIECPVLPPTSVRCMPPSAFEVAPDNEVTWQNQESYTEIEVLRNGEVIAVLPGDAESYIDDEIPVGFHRYAIRAIGVCSVTSYECPTWRDMRCGFGFGGEIELVGFEPPEDFIVYVDLTHPWVGEIEIEVENPDATLVQLFDVPDDNVNDDIRLTFADSGVPLEVSSEGRYDTGEIVQPIGPGTMSDLLEGTQWGTWDFTVRNTGPDPLESNWACHSLVPTRGFRRGDMNGDGVVFPITDVIYLLAYAFTGGDAPQCLDAADADDDGYLIVFVDVVYLLNFGFNGGPPPPWPFSSCGSEPLGEDDLDCAELPCSL